MTPAASWWKSGDPAAQLDGLRVQGAHRRRQRIVQLGPVEESAPVGGDGGGGHRRAQALARPVVQGGGGDVGGQQRLDRLGHAPQVEAAHGPLAEGQAGAHGGQGPRLLDHGDPEALPQQGQGEAEAADAGAGDQDMGVAVHPASLPGRAA